MPSDQVDMSNASRRTTTTTTTTRRYYNGSQADESAHDSSIDETNGHVSEYADDRYVRMSTTDPRNTLSNYDVFSETGEKLQGEQLNF
jgi:hypothetical protein